MLYTQHSPVLRGKITSLDLLARLCLMQSRIVFLARAHCWLMFSLVPPGSPDHFLKSCFPTRWPLTYMSAWGFFSSGAGLCTCSCWTSQGSHLVDLPSLLISYDLPSLLIYGWKHCSVVYQTLLPVTSAWGTLCFIMQIINKGQNWTQYWHWSTLLVNKASN